MTSFTPEEIIKIQKFKKGDRVRVTLSRFDCSCEGTIIGSHFERYRKGTPFEYEVHIKNTKKGCWFFERQLTLLT